MASDIPADIAVLTGPILFANLINWGLFGVLTVQVHLFYLSFPKDRSLIKAVVYSTYSIEIVQTALSTVDAFRIFGAGWGDSNVLDRVGYLGIMIPCLVSVLTFLSQAFYAWRIWILRGSWWIPILVVVLSLTQLVGGLISGIQIQLLGVLSQGVTGNNLFYVPSMCLSKLYSNVMLVMLNARIEIVGGRIGVSSTTATLLRVEVSHAASLPIPVTMPRPSDTLAPPVELSTENPPKRKSLLGLDWFIIR
ncbi:hypothetical protein EIP91_002986 [Steccherinum ochraceum]|uniref:Uncharacterized protein n=1 Tax=Steccherinum ochraceum TaxID=92696 RepID=A0A4R0RB37_9APHY|nr:hypothetical protein EIP91_002986 [Steccherinum ochraceum]